MLRVCRGSLRKLAPLRTSVRRFSEGTDASRFKLAGPRLRTVLSTTAGATLCVFSGSIVAWPLADLYLGPLLVLLGIRAGVKQGSTKKDGDDDWRSRFGRNVSVLTKSCADRHGHITVITSHLEGSGLAVERIASEERPVMYISVREATSPRVLHMSMLRGLYSELRLGVLGTMLTSMGVYWTVLFDMLVSNDPCHNTAVNFEVALQHGRRALRRVSSALSTCWLMLLVDNKKTEVRPLVIIDHFDEAIFCSSPRSDGDYNRRCLHEMVQRILAWCGAISFDERIADVVLIGSGGFSTASGAAWRQGAVHSKEFENMEDLRKFLAKVPYIKA
mmetsp:Transcript_44426/g.81092  ORF Transcript_44426/g.81092 Transcript_44426/m.81092 type:complete len:332 (+) Transcript_44426:70-1065(+)